MYVAWMYALFIAGVCVSLFGLLVICTASLSSSVTPDWVPNSLRSSPRGSRALQIPIPITAPTSPSSNALDGGGGGDGDPGGGDIGGDIGGGGNNGSGEARSLLLSPRVPSPEGVVVEPTRWKGEHCDIDHDPRLLAT